MTNSGSAGGDGALGKRRARFNRWRRGRPFAGGALLILASFVIAWIPINIAPDTILIGAAISPTIGLLFAALVFLCGIFALTRPANADIFGIFGGLFSLFSLYGALGGLFVGTALGLIGANLCYAWVDEDEEGTGDGSGGSNGTDTAREQSEESAFEFEDTDEDDSGGLFGTRSVGRAPDSGSHESRGAGGRTASLALLVFAVVVLSAFAHPLVTAAAQQSFPDQTQIDGTIVVAEQFSGQGYNHENVSTDTSNRASVPAARQSFSSAQIQGMTIYKNFRTGPQTPYSIVISGSSSSAPDGLSLTASEFYASQMSLAGVVPVARNKWSTCPGEDFLLSNGDIGNPPITAQDVTTNTHQLSANTVTIENLNLTVQQGAKSTSVTGTPECTRNPVETVLDVFTANALQLLVEEGRLNQSVLTNGTISNLTAPESVNQSETFDVSATVSNTGYLNDTQTVEYRFDNETRRTQNVSLAPNETTTVTFEDVTANASAGTYEHGVFAENGSVTGDITVVNETNASSLNATGNATDASGNTTNATTNGTAVNATPAGQNGTSGTSESANETGGNETTTASANETTTTTETATPTTAETTTTTATPTETPTETSTETQTSTGTVSTQSSDSGSTTADTSGNETTTTETTTTETPTTTEAPAETMTAGNTTTNATTTGSALIEFP